MRLFLKEDVLGGLSSEDLGKLSTTLKERNEKRRKKFEESLKGTLGGEAPLSGQVYEPALPAYQPVSTQGSQQAFQRQNEAIESVAQSAGALGDVQTRIPERRDLNDTMLGGTAIADALRDIVSTLPAKFRDFKPTAQGYDELESRRLQEDLQKSSIETQNLERRLGANLEADKARLEGALRGTDFALGQEAAARGEAQFKYGADFDATRFTEQVRQFGLSHALALNADAREAEAAGIRNALAKNPYAFIDETAKSIAADFGGDVSKARAALLSDVILGSQINQATLDRLTQQIGMDKAEFERRKKLYQLISPEKEAQHTLWQMDFEIREGEKRLKALDAQIASSNRANRGEPDPRLVRQIGDIDSQVERYRTLVDVYDQRIVEMKAELDDEGQFKYSKADIDEVRKERENANRQAKNWKDKANALYPGAYPD